MGIFYAAMGGFVINTEEDYAHGSPRFSLEIKGILYLAKNFDLPDIPKESILDRSKADNLAKGLVCVQAGCLIVQCIARLASHLPLTFLEINTLAHVMCALAIYGFWWHKPLAVCDPIPLSGDWVRPVSAVLSMGVHKTKIHPSLPGFNESRSLLFSLSNRSRDSSTTSRSTERPVQSSGESRFRVVRGYGPVGKWSPDHFGRAHLAPPPPILTSTIVSLRLGEALADTGFEPRRDCFCYSFVSREMYETLTHEKPPDDIKDFEIQVSPFIMIQLDRVNVVRWELASRALQDYPMLRTPFRLGQSINIGFTTYRIPNFPEITGLATWGLIIALGAASAGYGGLHAAAWHEYFPTSVERMLWKISSLSIASSGFVLGTLSAIVNEYKSGGRFKMVIRYCLRPSSIQDIFKFSPKHTRRAIVYLVTALLSICVVAYSCARIFLVLEAFISLRRPPVAAYETPQWPQYFLHL
ncbi:hypothetical protein FGG08_000521 [Glutinoglossum americanum]|uniref:Uncharacterized protein n=1 Tax=Glutinoglossum americanum TaxID=1670608 RepID=A0A9P8ICS4_9PEZI|nr:hypothetical protein FGG08_000521 [Glutinoglossum americanum]